MDGEISSIDKHKHRVRLTKTGEGEEVILHERDCDNEKSNKMRGQIVHLFIRFVAKASGRDFRHGVALNKNQSSFFLCIPYEEKIVNTRSKGHTVKDLSRTYQDIEGKEIRNLLKEG
jgi:hypothetical protein